ncbi:hypothetical protein KDN34_14220 [Shewanella yunxiaonensis]|uniref:Lipoprotein n=1 Tax=Shewanella yunxiaonensis TaxID=2829809 RepID=A0ABX7YRE7_9GAMM|nr:MULTISPECIES: hypothetical protein [Shewanella]MDF0535866.1 hypothetical protein [Shewanella sp. A32]QUN05338.1 hypothetical protein KDN34_14220 [Shewanella yunxiaonensis]
MATRTTLLTFSPVLLAALLSGCHQGNGKFTDAEICRASVATALNKDPSIFNVDDVNGKLVYVSYHEQDDWKHDIYRCKIEGSKAIWATEKGPWKTQSSDAQITFAANDDKLTIVDTTANGQHIDKHYKFDQLKVDTPSKPGLKG